jgi:hypothetical protein
MAGDAAVPEASTVIMARRFTIEHCTNASVPALRFDATTLAAPLKYSLLETSGTSPSSSATSSPTLPKLMDPSASSAAAGSSSGTKRRGRPPGSGNKAKVLAR